MKRISSIGSYLKRIYRIYNNQLLNVLQEKGFTDLRPSFLEVLLYICESEGPTIKEIGNSCGLKKQTMTSHLNELQKRGYIVRKSSETDKREQRIFLTDYGEKFRFSLFEALERIEEAFIKDIGDIELDRINTTLENMHEKINPLKNETLDSRIQLNLSLDF
jgi:DNA-binding MarR family transcriptional regulator